MLRWLKEYGQTATNTLLLSYTYKATITLQIGFKIVLTLFDQHQSIWASFVQNFKWCFLNFMRGEILDQQILIDISMIIWIKWCKCCEHRLISLRLRTSTPLTQSSHGVQKQTCSFCKPIELWNRDHYGQHQATICCTWTAV